MKSKMETANEFRKRMNEQWKSGAKTVDELKEMEEDRKAYKKLARAATEEWLEGRRQGRN